MFVFDVKDWDNSTGLSVPGNSAQPLSPHYKDLANAWGVGKYFPMAFGRKKVEEVMENRLVLAPLRNTVPAPTTGDVALRPDGSVDVDTLFEPVQPDLFALQGAQPNLWADFDGDGDLDLFVGFRGQLNRLYRNDHGTFVDVAAEQGVAGETHATTSTWGDYDNDGRPDVYVVSYLSAVMNVRDRLFHNEGGRFRDVTPSVLLKNDATHGAQWVDYDQDGDLDLALADNGTTGVHFLFRNRLPASLRQRGLNVLVEDERGRYTRAGAEMRVFAAGTRTLLGTRLVDTGSGYCSQNLMPVHVGLPSADSVDVEVTTLTAGGRKVTRVSGVDPKRLSGKPLVVKTMGAAQPTARVAPNP
jgi:hypothetical protein